MGKKPRTETNKHELDETMKGTNNTKEKLLFKEESYEIQGAIIEVYREMGCGFLESVYQECLEKELKKRSILFVASINYTTGPLTFRAFRGYKTGACNGEETTNRHE